MKNRVLLIALGSIAIAPIGAQNAIPAKKSATAPAAIQRTPWGHPDLQGIWDYATITPMERPSEFAGKEVLTPEEAETIRAYVAAQARTLQQSEGQGPAPTQLEPPTIEPPVIDPAAIDPTAL